MKLQLLLLLKSLWIQFTLELEVEMIEMCRKWEAIPHQQWHRQHNFMHQFIRLDSVFIKEVSPDGIFW